MGLPSSTDRLTRDPLRADPAGTTRTYGSRISRRTANGPSGIGSMAKVTSRAPRSTESTSVASCESSVSCTSTFGQPALNRRIASGRILFSTLW